MVFQSFHLESHLAVVENVLLRWFVFNGGERYKQALRRAVGLIGMVGLAGLADRRVSDLSGGERQRVAIARALFARPRLLVADEPTGNLDEETAASVCNLLYQAPARSGCAVIVVTHDPVVASGADRIIELSCGSIRSSTTRAGTG
jgi:ABC-type lipoprotein export system ATPase subunit